MIKNIEKHKVNIPLTRNRIRKVLKLWWMLFIGFILFMSLVNGILFISIIDRIKFQ